VERSRAVGIDHQVVAEQAILQLTVRRIDRIAQRLPLPEHLSLDDVDVEIAVVVVVEQRHTGRHDLRVVELAGHAVEVDEVEAGRVRVFSEPIDGRALRIGGRSA
jgi:hypothetical protein